MVFISEVELKDLSDKKVKNQRELRQIKEVSLEAKSLILYLKQSMWRCIEFVFDS